VLLERLKRYAARQGKKKKRRWFQWYDRWILVKRTYWHDCEDTSVLSGLPVAWDASSLLRTLRGGSVSIYIAGELSGHSKQIEEKEKECTPGEVVSMRQRRLHGQADLDYLDHGQDRDYDHDHNHDLSPRNLKEPRGPKTLSGVPNKREQSLAQP
jgi:hypothetical protein